MFYQDEPFFILIVGKFLVEFDKFRFYIKKLRVPHLMPFLPSKSYK